MSLLNLSRRFKPQEPNLYHLVMDIAWFGLALATTSRFLSVYAIHLGATASQLTWLTALPALVLLFSSMFSGWWRSRHQNTPKAVLLPSFGFRLNFFLLALTPFLPPDWQPIWLIASVSLTAIPQGVSGVIFLGLMRESVTSESWTLLNSRRHMAMNTAIALGVLVAGLWLAQMPFPMNYQVMFLGAFVATLVSLWHVTRIKPIYTAPSQPVNKMDRQLWKSPQVKHMLWVVMLTHIPFFMIYPLVPLQLINGFQAEESFIALFGLAELVGGIVMASRANNWMSRWGQSTTMAVAMAVTGIAVGIIALAPIMWLTLPAAFLLGGSWTLVGIGIMGLISEGVPAEDALSYNMIFMQCVGLATFIGPLLGNALMSSGINLVTVLMLGAGFRLIAGIFLGVPLVEQVIQTIVNEVLSVRKKANGRI